MDVGQRRRRGMLLAGVLSLASWTCVLPLYGATEREMRVEPGERLLVGAVVGGSEVGSLDVWRVGDEFFVPLEELADYISCRVVEDDIGTAIHTPRGEVRLAPEDLRDIEGTLYVRQWVLETKLATRVGFDRAGFALIFDVPWHVAEDDRRPEPRALEPDVTAPSASLSTIWADLRYSRLGDQQFTQGGTRLAGALAGGYWRMRYQTDFEGVHQLRNYAWIYKGRQHLVLAGNQRVRVHPLLRGMEFTGAQFAWTNQNLELFSRPSTSSELLSREMQPITAFEGLGPPAGFAELWIDGMLVGREPIGLDGRYAFVDVSIPARQSSRVEIRLYDRHNPGVPVEIIEQRRTASAYLLPAGAAVHMGGGGAAGNAVQNQLDPAYRTGRFAGFYQTRHGLSDTLTVEGAVQAADDGAQAFGGFIGRLSRSFVMGVGVGGSSEDAWGYSVDIEGLPLPWRVLGRLQASQAGFDPLYPFKLRDDYLEVGYSGVRNLDVALVGRSRLNATVDVNYVLPAATWRPDPALWLKAWPDLDGDYRFDLRYQFAPYTRLTLNSVKDRRFGQIWHGIRPNLQLSFDADVGGLYPDRYAVLVHGWGRSRWQPVWSVGPLWTDGTPGYLIDGRLTVTPGVVAQARVESSAVGTQGADASQPRLLMNLVADLGVSRGRLLAARTTAVREGRGGIAGVIHVDAPRGFPNFDLRDVPISLDGRRVARTNSSGEFFVGDLRPGVYHVELSPDNLPIELVPHLRSLNAEVSGAAVTRVDFVVRPEFGVAGRVTDAAGRPVSELRVEVVDGSGQVVVTADTDRFGLFRVDGLPVGTYMLRPKPFEVPELDPLAVERIIRIEDDFLFEQDLTLPVTVESTATGSNSPSG